MGKLTIGYVSLPEGNLLKKGRLQCSLFASLLLPDLRAQFHQEVATQVRLSELSPGKLTVWPWKSPIFDGN